MTLKLPEPLPYDFIDEWLDETYKFSTETYEDLFDENGRRHDQPITYQYQVCERRTDDEFGGVSNFIRPIFELCKNADYSHLPYDEEGYVTYSGLGGWWCPMVELTDEAIDIILALGREMTDDERHEWFSGHVPEHWKKV